MKFKKGDIVGRISYGKDIAFVDRDGLLCRLELDFLPFALQNLQTAS